VVTTDEAFMERALLVGERGRGRTSPNPAVGAVLVSPDGIVVGQGFTQEPGGDHAEIVALGKAGSKAEGATLYCTLEPCSHVGRTGPCVERIVSAGVRRVVAATVDRNPLMAGRGFEFLRTHGVAVVDGVSRQAADRQHAPFFTWITRRRPFVIAKMATSADGFVGAASRRVRLTGPAADRYFHRQRAEIDAIAVGGATVAADNPLLTPRGAYRFRPLTRVVFDWSGRVPAEARLFGTLEAGPVIMVAGAEAVRREAVRFRRLAALGVEIAETDSRELGPILERLARRDIVTLLVEGGPALHAAFAAADFIDRVQHVTTPLTLGAGVPAARLVPDGASPAVHEKRLGDDILVEFDVHGTD
jgi:diaminohydroxyphosphoribosylaminopyrimidine deaminase/5-amino-6-(5-phosphoribosylamino)uracil reductase